MKTDNNNLDRSIETSITDRLVMDAIKYKYASGARYANKVINLAIELSDAAIPFYTGAFFGDFGLYPFLNVREYHFDNGTSHSDQVVVESRFDYSLFVEFVNSLQLSNKVKRDIDKCVCDNYKNPTGDLDDSYMLVLVHLKGVLECLKCRYEYAQSIISRFDDAYIGYRYSVRIDQVTTVPYLMKRIKKFNQKKGAEQGKRFSLAKIDSSKDRVMLICEKYNKITKNNNKLNTNGYVSE